MIKEGYRQILFFSVIVIVLGIFLGPCQVRADDREIAVTNTLETGTVEIDLAQWMIEGGKEVPWENRQEILPGREISLIPRIKNLGEDCYVRVWVSFVMKKEVEDPISCEDLLGLGEDWIRIGDCFYYKNILRNNQYTDLFEGYKIPEQWNTRYDESGNIVDYYTDNQVMVRFTADAVQSRNFTPDFQSETPWGEIEIQKCRNRDGYEFRVYESSEKTFLSVVYEEEADRLLAQPENFFENLGTLMPGDRIRDVIHLENRNKPAVLYFKTEVIEEKEILEKIELKISFRKDDAEVLLYQGPLNSRELSKYESLGEYGTGEAGELIFELSVPEKLDNAYSMNQGKVRWWFMAKEEELPREWEIKEKQTVKTGDRSSMVIYACMGIVSLMVLSMGICTRIRRRK